MKAVYPVVFTPLEEGYAVYVPDFDMDTQGDDLPHAIEMARDAIGLMGIDMEDDGKAPPAPSTLQSIAHEPGAFVSLVDIDYDAYRRAHEQRTVRRNVSLPSWLNTQADQAGINVSAVLQSALKQALHVTE